MSNAQQVDDDVALSDSHSGKQKPGNLYSGRLVFVLGGSALGDRADSRSARNSELTLTSQVDAHLMISSKHWIAPLLAEGHSCGNDLHYAQMSSSRPL